MRKRKIKLFFVFAVNILRFVNLYMCYFYTNENSKERMYLIFYASYPRNFRELTFVTLLNSTKNTLKIIIIW